MTPSTCKKGKPDKPPFSITQNKTSKLLCECNKYYTTLVVNITIFYKLYFLTVLYFVLKQCTYMHSLQCDSIEVLTICGVSLTGDIFNKLPTQSTV